MLEKVYPYILIQQNTEMVNMIIVVIQWVDYQKPNDTKIGFVFLKQIFDIKQTYLIILIQNTIITNKKNNLM